MTNMRKPEEFESQLSEIYPRVYRFSLKLTRNADTAADITQETFVRAYRAKNGPRQGADPIGWFFRIAFNCFLDLRRNKANRLRTVSFEEMSPEGSEFEVSDDRPNPEQEFLQEKFSARVATALAALTEEQRELIRLADLQEVPHAELARRYGCGATTIKTRVHRAHVAFKRHLAAFDLSGSTELSTAI